MSVCKEQLGKGCIKKYNGNSSFVKKVKNGYSKYRRRALKNYKIDSVKYNGHTV